MRCALPDTAAFEPLFPSIKNAAEERARAQYYRGSLEPVATRQINSGNTISFHPECGYLSLYQFEQGVLANHLLDGVVFAVAGFGLLAISAAGTVATLLDMLLLAQERTMAMKEDEG